MLYDEVGRFPVCFKVPRELIRGSSYNSVQGEFVGASRRLVTDILRKEWGFKGLVISDWAGTYSCKEPVNAGMDLEMVRLQIRDTRYRYSHNSS